MDYKELKTYVEKLNKEEKKKPDTYAKDYLDFLNRSLAYAVKIEKSKTLKEKKKIYYDQIEKINNAYKSGRLMNVEARENVYATSPAYISLQEAFGSLEGTMKDIWYADTSLTDAGTFGKELKAASMDVLEKEVKEKEAEYIRSAQQKQIDQHTQLISEKREAFVETLHENNRMARMDKEARENIDGALAQAYLISDAQMMDHAHKANLLNATSQLQDFYYNNLMFPEQRYQLNSIEKAQAMVKPIQDVFTETKDYLEKVKEEDPKAYQAVSDFLNGVDQNLLDDLNRVVQTTRYNIWADWETKSWEARKELDEYQKLGKQELMEKYGLVNDDQFYFQAMLESDKERFEHFPDRRDIMTVLAIDENTMPETVQMNDDLKKIMNHITQNKNHKLPESVMPDADTVNLHELVREMKKAAVQAGVNTVAHYVPEKDGSTHFMNVQEIDSLEQDYEYLSNGLELLQTGAQTAGAEQKDLEKIGAVRQGFDQEMMNLYNAGNYIRDNLIAKEPDAEIRPFSMYELQGGFNPDYGDHMQHHVKDLNDDAKDLLDLYNDKETSSKTKKALKKSAELLNEALPAVNKLTEEVIPGLLKNKEGKEGVLTLLTKDRMQGLTEPFVQAQLSVRNYLNSIDERRQKGEEISIEESKVYDDMKKVYTRVSSKVNMLYFLHDNVAGDDMAKEIARFQDARDQGIADEEYSKEEVKELQYIMMCKNMLDNQQLYPQFLFEDPQSNRASSLVGLRMGRQNIVAVNEREEAINKIQWNLDGTRYLSSLPEYQIQNAQLGDRGNVTQYATFDDRKGFAKVVESSMKDMRKSLHFAKVKHKVTDPETGEEKVTTEEIDVEQRIRDFMEQNKDTPVIDFGLNADGTGGMEKAFTPDELATPSIRFFVRSVNRNLLNAGHGVEQQQTYIDDFTANVPSGYNTGVAKQAMNMLASDLPGLMAPVYGYANASIPQYNSKADAEKTTDVVLMSEGKNYNATSNDDVFYTTTSDFRRSDFVGHFIYKAGNVDDIIKGFEGKSGAEIIEMLKADRNLQANPNQREDNVDVNLRNNLDQKINEKKEEQKEAPKKTNSDIQKYDQFNKGKILASMADLQVMDYLTGIPLRQTQQLRMGFKKDKNGEPVLDSVSGANIYGVKPFADLSPDEEQNLIQPENMQVITKEMREKIGHWHDREFSKQESDYFMQLPKASQDRFLQRVDKLYNVILESEKEKFEDLETGGLRGSITTKPGKIRVLDREKFDDLLLDNLAVGKNSAPINRQSILNHKNIFDVLSDLPKDCAKAMADKAAARLTGVKETQTMRGSGYQTSMQKLDKERIETAYEKQFCARDTDRIMDRMMNNIGGRLVDVNTNRKKETVWHILTGNSARFDDIIETQQSVMEEIEHARKINAMEWVYKMNKGAFKKHFGEAGEKELQEALKEREEMKRKLQKEHGGAPTRLEWIQEEVPKKDKDGKEILDPQTNKPVMQTVSKLVEVKDVPEKELGDNFSGMDLHVYHKALDKMDLLRTKMEKYLDKREGASSSFGKDRYEKILNAYNTLNRTMAEYAATTGDTRYSPREASLVNGKLTYVNMYQNRTAFEMNTPDFVYTKLKAEAKQEMEQRKLDQRWNKNGEPDKSDWAEFDQFEIAEAKRTVKTQAQIAQEKADAKEKSKGEHNKITLDELKNKGAKDEPKKKSYVKLEDMRKKQEIQNGQKHGVDDVMQNNNQLKKGKK